MSADRVPLRDWIAVLGGVLGAFMAVLDIQITNASIRDISGAIGASLDESSWISIAYLVPRTFMFAIKGDIVSHKRWAKFTFPIWYYVSVTGVLVYFFLYVWWPAAPARA